MALKNAKERLEQLKIDEETNNENINEIRSQLDISLKSKEDMYNKFD